MHTQVYLILIHLIPFYLLMTHTQYTGGGFRIPDPEPGS